MGTLLYSLLVLLTFAAVVALSIATIAVIIWSFHVSFLYGVISVIGIEVLPIIILITLVVRP